MDEQLDQYLKTTLPPNEEWIIAMEEQAERERVPIMDPLSMNFLLQLIKMIKPKRILEIGAAIGYSALRMSTAHPEAVITTIEKDASRYEQAITHIRSRQKQDNIQVILGDALEEMLSLTKASYDLIFIDAAKGQYERFFNLSCPLLRNSGVVISDNVLFRGYVSGQKQPPKKYEKLTNKLQNFNEWLTSHPNFDTTIVPLGDGIAISYQNVT